MRTASNNRDEFDTSGMLDLLLSVDDLTRHPLGPLHISQRLDQSEFIRLLNEGSSKLAPSAGLMSRAAIVPSVSEFLRGWVDEWLDSGVSPGGTEKPSERKFQKGGSIGGIVLSYSKRNRIELIVTESGLHIFFRPYPKPGVAALAGMPEAGEANKIIAQQNLVFFLLSELRFKLAKCRREGCDRYFVLKHWTRTYKCGTRCPDHQRERSLESASRATSGERTRAEERLTQLAAQRFAKRIQANRNWSQDKALKEALVKYLNGRIEREELLRRVYLGPGRRGITGKWLGHAKNRNAIEAIAKGAD